jgi:hypothetical protein
MYRRLVSPVEEPFRCVTIADHLLMNGLAGRAGGASSLRDARRIAQMLAGNVAFASASDHRTSFTSG